MVKANSGRPKQHELLLRLLKQVPAYARPRENRGSVNRAFRSFRRAMRSFRVSVDAVVASGGRTALDDRADVVRELHRRIKAEVERLGLGEESRELVDDDLLDDITVRASLRALRDHEAIDEKAADGAGGVDDRLKARGLVRASQVEWTCGPNRGQQVNSQTLSDWSNDGLLDGDGKRMKLPVERRAARRERVFRVDNVALFQELAVRSRSIDTTP